MIKFTFYIFFYSAVQIYEIHISMHYWAAREGNAQYKNEKPLLSMSQKDKMAYGNPRRLSVSHSPFSEADFWEQGTGHLRSSVQQIWKLIWKCLNLLQFSPACKKSFLTRKKHAIVDRLLTETYSLG